MRISFVLPELNLSGGIKVVTQYAEFLSGRGHSVSVVTAGPRRLGPRERIRNLFRSARPPEGHHKLHAGVRHIQSRHRGPEIIGDLPEADVLIATWWETAEWIAPSGAEKGMKTYFIQDHEIFPYMPVERVAATYRLPFRKIVVSSWLRDVMTETYGARDVAIVANGVDLERFASSARHRPKPPVFGLLMSQSPRKNSGMALKAFKRAQSTRPDLRLLAFGVEPEPDAFRGDPQMRYCSMPDQDEIPCLYGSCTAWLFPSESEGFGLPILESMASGTPVIATRAGAAPDLVNETNGALVATDADAMADAILRFAALSDEDWTAFSAAARSTAEAHDLRAAGQAFEAAILDEDGTAAAAG